jgi:hypothetical protein
MMQLAQHKRLMLAETRHLKPKKAIRNKESRGKSE